MPDGTPRPPFPGSASRRPRRKATDPRSPHRNSRQGSYAPLPLRSLPYRPPSYIRPSVPVCPRSSAAPRCSRPPPESASFLRPSRFPFPSRFLFTQLFLHPISPSSLFYQLIYHSFLLFFINFHERSLDTFVYSHSLHHKPHDHSYHHINIFQHLALQLTLLILLHQPLYRRSILVLMSYM